MDIDPEDAVRRLNAAYGSPRGARTLHAKGFFCSGTFTAAPEAGELCRAGHLQGVPVPVTVRWSNASGRPQSSDRAPDVRGMAVRFHLPDGSATDLLGQTAPRFPVRDPRLFVELTEASRSRGRLALWLARHPRAAAAVLANGRAGAITPPYSFAEAHYHPIHAYGWLDRDGARRWVRYELVPEEGERPAGTFEGRDRLREEMAARLARSPVRFELRVTLAAAGDDPHDPTSRWQGERVLGVGTLEVTALDPTPESEGDVVVFDPTRVVDGIVLSDDPILRYRPAAYAASVSRRQTPPGA